MAEDLNKLSSEDIRRFEKTISEVKALTARQEEIAKNVLELEQEIGQVRIASLKEFFKDYTQFYKSLDANIARKTSELNDAFLVMDRITQESYKRAGKITAKVASDEKRSDSKKGAGSNPPGGGGSGGGPSGGDSSGNPSTADSSGILPDSKRAELGEANTAEKIITRLKAFNENYLTVEEQLNAITSERLDSVISIEQVRTAGATKRKEMAADYAQKEIALESTITELAMARLQEEEDKEAQMRAAEIAYTQEVYSAELEAQNLLNKIIAERAFAKQNNFMDIGSLDAKSFKANNDQKVLQQLEAKRVAYIKKQELIAARKNNGILTAEEAARIQKQAAKKFSIDKENLEKLGKRQVELDAARAMADERKDMRDAMSAFGKNSGKTFEERKQALRDLTQTDGEADVGKAVSAAILAVSDLAKQLEKQVDDIAQLKGDIDTRLQGSNNDTRLGSYWDQMVQDMTSVGAINPYFKQADFASNINKLVADGIAFDIEQRAFLETIKNKIATTFEVADGTLLRLIRIQQEDTTAGRLGMESALNAFLNNMYENTEYLKQVADSVRGSLAEMQALMSGAEAAEVEYQVQKWLGSLYSVGMSQEAVNSISTTLGQIAAGQIEGLTNGGTGNLLVMAANDAGMSIADILTDGLDSEETNKLLQAAVNYLAELSDSSKDNQVVQQQLANVFGVKASDLRAATNLVIPGSTDTIYGNSLTYSGMMGQLSKMAGSMASRTSMGEMMTNVWENGMYTAAGSMASNPVSYIIYKLASVVDDAAGGIDLPFVNVMGYGVDLNTTVSDLMRVAAVGTGLLGSMGSIVAGLGNSFSGQAMLSQLGIDAGAGIAITPRGGGGGGFGSSMTGGGSQTTSGSGYVGNSSGSDIKDSTIQEANDTKKQQMIEAKEEAEANEVDILNTTVVQIYELLNDVVQGNSTFKVKVEGYGLTNAGGAGSGTGGVRALGGASGAAGSTNGSGGGLGAGGGVNSSGLSGSVDFGSWTTT